MEIDTLKDCNNKRNHTNRLRTRYSVSQPRPIRTPASENIDKKLSLHYYSRLWFSWILSVLVNPLNWWFTRWSAKTKMVGDVFITRAKRQRKSKLMNVWLTKPSSPHGLFQSLNLTDDHDRDQNVATHVKPWRYSSRSWQLMASVFGVVDEIRHVCFLLLWSVDCMAKQPIG
jgi:hypothetical protein